jgi:hypothetical protein
MRLLEQSMNVANKEGHNKSKSHVRYKHMIIAALVSITLLSSAFAMISETGVQKAYAAKGGQGGSGGGNSSSSDHGNNGSDKGNSNDKGQSNKTSTTTTSNSTDKEQRSKDHNSTGDNDNSSKGQSQHEKSDNAVSRGNNSDLAKAEKFKLHQLSNETVSWPYSANTTYFLEANGTAKAIGSNTTNVTSTNAELSTEMSIWRTTKNLVSMDVMDGSSITVDGKTMEFYSGQAHYLPNMHKMLLVGFVIENQGNTSETGNEDTGGNQNNTTDTGATNQTSTTTTTNQTLTTTDITNQTSTEIINTNETSTNAVTNQTSTEVPSAGQEIDEDGEAEPVLKHIKLWIKVTGQKGESLPSSGTPSSMTIEVLSPQSKISSEWFLQMDGELYTSP